MKVFKVMWILVFLLIISVYSVPAKTSVVRVRQKDIVKYVKWRAKSISFQASGDRQVEVNVPRQKDIVKYAKWRMSQ